MKKTVLTVALLVLALVAYLGLWPVPVQPVAWNAPAAPGYTGPHAVNNKLAGLQLISLGVEEGPSTSCWRATASFMPRWPAARSFA